MSLGDRQRPCKRSITPYSIRWELWIFMRIFTPISNTISKSLNPVYLSLGQYRLFPILNLGVLRTRTYVIKSTDCFDHNYLVVRNMVKVYIFLRSGCFHKRCTINGFCGRGPGHFLPYVAIFLIVSPSYGLLLTNLELVSNSSKALIQQLQVGTCVVFCWF